MQRLLLSILTAGLAAAPCLPAAPARIVSTTPSITEILFALGAGPRVVGVTTFCRHPEAVRQLPKIGTFLDPNLETILGLRPDLVVVQKNPVRLTERLRAVRLPVLEVNPESMDGVYSTITALAGALDSAARGRELSARLRGELDTLRRKTEGRPRPKVLFVVGRTPGTLDGLIAAARGSYLDELFSIAGGVNAFADSPTAYPKISHEELLARDPDVILDMGDTMGDIPGTAAAEARRKAVLRLWSRFPNLRAVRAGRVVAVSDDRFVVPGPRMGEAVRLFGKLLHPELAW